MKAIKAYALWSPVNKGIAFWSLCLTQEEVGNFLAHGNAGYRVIPVTISYEPPATAKKKGKK